MSHDIPNKLLHCYLFIGRIAFGPYRVNIAALVFEKFLIAEQENIDKLKR